MARSSRTFPEMSALTEAYAGLRVLVIGDVMVDEYIVGHSQRISPEMPVPLLLRTDIPKPADDLVRLGGAGNTARNLASLGAEVVLIGVCGVKDPASQQLTELVEQHVHRHRLSIDCRLVAQDGLLTTHKLRIVSKQLVQLYRIDTEREQILKKSTIFQANEKISDAMAWCQCVVVSDYAKGMISGTVFEHIVKEANGKPIVVDPKETLTGQRFQKYSGATTIIPNEAELRRSFELHQAGRPIEDLFCGEIQSHLNNIGVSNIICTRGPKGLIYSDNRSDSAKTVKGRSVEVSDVTGASDTVTAVVALSQASNDDLDTAASIAEAAGRLKVTKRLTGTIHVGELIQAIDPMHARRAKTKVKRDLDDLISTLSIGQSRTNTIALVTGCFDILHLGHVKLLERAAELADNVIVAVNSDDYIRRSPHKVGGPYNDEESRAEMVASLSTVDFVTTFDEDTPEVIIQRLEPDFLVMGEEYKQKYQDRDLPGMEYIDEFDISVHFCNWPKTSGLSSTYLAGRISSQFKEDK